jgi:hypothetical protein
VGREWTLNGRVNVWADSQQRLMRRPGKWKDVVEESALSMPLMSRDASWLLTCRQSVAVSFAPA